MRQMRKLGKVSFYQAGAFSSFLNVLNLNIRNSYTPLSGKKLFHKQKCFHAIRSF